MTGVTAHRGMLQVAITNLERQLDAASERLAAAGVTPGPIEVHGDGVTDASVYCELARASGGHVVIDVSVFIDGSPAAPIADILTAITATIDEACAA